MKVCADTSFIMKLLVSEPGSVTAAGLYRYLNRPRLPLTQIHQMEVESALAQKAFIARNNGAKKDVVRREKAAGIAKLETWLQKSLLIETEIRWLECLIKHSSSFPCKVKNSVVVPWTSYISRLLFVIRLSFLSHAMNARRKSPRPKD
jgi:hypothetical protein